jgi:hypothetical protein
MNFIPLSREEQRRMAARRKAKEEANVRATTSSAAGEASLIVHHGLPQPIEHILEKDSVTDQLHVEIVPEHLSSIERVEPSHQEEDSHVKTSIIPEQSYPHHEVAEIPQSVH